MMRVTYLYCLVNKKQNSNIENSELINALVSGFHYVITKQDYLNEINVFPVADGDTGTNLSLTLTSALEVTKISDRKNLHQLLEKVAEALLDSARGNSGAIFAQFFQGLSDFSDGYNQFNVHSLSKAINQGYQYAYEALTSPREGTVLSVMHAFANSITELISENPNIGFEEIINKAQLSVDKALLNTTQQLSILKKAGLVDSGAQGFVFLIKGMSYYLENKEIKKSPNNPFVNSIKKQKYTSASNHQSQFRFCTECFINSDEINRKKLKEALVSHGDSMVLAGSKHKVKVHIHTDYPDKVFTVAKKFGEVTGKKADDMFIQQDTVMNKSKKFVVITDSGADISDEDIERLNIHMVPCRIQFGDEDYLDKVSISSKEFYFKIKENKNYPTTSRPSPGEFLRQFQFLTSHYEKVLSITLSSHASGTYEGAKLAAKRNKLSKNIQVIDSLNASMGQGQLTVLAAECAAAGLSINEALQIIKKEIPKIKTFIMLQDLTYAVKGGRLPRWVKLITDFFQLTPIMCIKKNGKIGIATCFFGRRNQISKYAKFISSLHYNNEKIQVGIGHAVLERGAEELARKLQKNIKQIDKMTICELGPALGAHGGPGTLTVSTCPVISIDNLTDRVN